MTRKPNQELSTPPKLIVPRSEAQQKLEAHKEKGNEIVNRPINSQAEMDQAEADGEMWRDYAIRLLPTLFDSASIADEYQKKTKAIPIGGVRDIPYAKRREIFEPWMNYRVRELVSILQSLELYSESLTAHTKETVIKNPQADALEKIELIIRRFHIVAAQLLARHGDRATLEINDEYDVQDLFHALLRLFFDDVRNEETTQSYAGGYSRIDFLLKAEQVTVELKMTREGLKGKDAGDQLIIDINRYHAAHPDCKMFIAFVYDPKGFIKNPRGLEHDLNKTINGMPVKVIVTPR